MFCIPTEIPETTNCQTFRLFRILKMLFCFHIALGILMMFIDLMSGIWMLFASLLFLLVIWMKNWCISVMYIIYCLMDLITSIVFAGNGLESMDLSNKQSIFIILYCIKFPFYLVLIYYTFLTYRELKGLYIEGCANGGFVGYGTSEERRPRTQESRHIDHVQPFQGAGFRLGK